MNHESIELLAKQRIADMRREAAADRLARMGDTKPTPPGQRPTLRGILGRLAHAA